MKFKNFKKVFSYLISLTLTVNIVVTATSVAEDKFETNEPSTISSEVLEAIEAGEEYIPVVIWRTEAEDSYIENAVIDEIGFSISDLEESYTLPSDDLMEQLSIAATGEVDSYLEKLMNSHLELTEESRRIEQEKTETYLSTRRSVISDYYSSNAETFINNTGLSDSEVIFTSCYSPMIVCNLSPEEIYDLSTRDDVEEIMLFEKMEIVNCTFPNTTMKDTMGINNINQYLGLTGTGVKIGIYETSVVSSNYADAYELDMSKVTILGEPYIQNGGFHSTWCASVAAGDKGVAPDADIYSASLEDDFLKFSWNNYDNVKLAQLEELIRNDVKIINISWASQNDVTCYNYWAKYVDYLIAADKVTIVCATGNNADAFISNPSSAYNCIAVNAFFDVNPANQQPEELLCDYSYEHGNGCFKPDVTAVTFGPGGTSTATPVISGMIALLIQYKPSLASHPELTKAILMASCHKKASKLYVDYNNIPSLNETMLQGLTDRQGAGIPNMYTMISIVSQHSYACGVINGTTQTEVISHIIQPKYGAEYMNVSMSYLQTNVSPSNTSGTADDYDMQLTNSAIGTKTSNESNSSTELIYTSLSSGLDEYLNNCMYTLRIYKFKGSSKNLVYGYAWSTNAAKFTATPEEEGIYYLRNNNSGLYLTADNSTLETRQTAYSGNTEQMWIIKYSNSTGTYNLQSAFGDKYGLKIGSAITSTQKKAMEGSESEVNPITTVFNDDGTYTFKQTINGLTYALGIYQNSSSDTYAVWSPFSTNNKSQKWALESIQY